MFKVLLIEAMKELKTPIARRMITKAKTPRKLEMLGCPTVTRSVGIYII